MSRNGMEARKRRNLVRAGKASQLPIRTTVEQAIRLEGLDTVPEPVEALD